MEKSNKDAIRDMAIQVTEYLLDNYPYLLASGVMETKEGHYTEQTWELQDAITESISENLNKV